jgi:hypothetical protein
VGERKDRDSERGWGNLESKTWMKQGQVKGATFQWLPQGQPEAWAPPTSGAFELGVTGHMRCCHPSPHTLVNQGWGTGDKSGQPSSIPSQPL